MKGRSGWLLLSVVVLGGCAHPSADDQAIQAALQGREAAYTRLTRAITAYCEARHASLAARQNCTLEKQLELLKIARLHEADLAQVPELPPPVPDLPALAPASWVKCERVARETACRLSLAFAPPPAP